MLLSLMNLGTLGAHRWSALADGGLAVKARPFSSQWPGWTLLLHHPSGVPQANFSLSAPTHPSGSLGLPGVPRGKLACLSISP